MFAKSGRGFTLVEMLVAVTVFAVVTMLSLSAFAEMVGFVNSQDSVTTTDMVANRALRDMTDLLRPAILPVYVDNDNRDDPKNPFHDIDSRRHGFGGSTGRSWLKKLKEGMDSIAYVVPVDAQHLGDFLDSEGRLQTGQIRGAVSYLSTKPSGVAHTGNDFVIRSDAGEPANVLAMLDPDKFVDGTFEKLHTPSDADWTNLWSGGSLNPNATCFTAIRFVPVLDASKNPVIFNEADLISNRSTKVDLDGDGRTDGDFHLGKLQLVYSGSYEGQFYWVNSDDYSNGHGQVGQIILPLTPEIVLRRADADDRTPIFRLLDYETSNMDASSSSDTAGLLETSKSTKSKEGMSLGISLLLLEHEGIDAAKGQVRINPSTKSVKARWYETEIPLKNMVR